MKAALSIFDPLNVNLLRELTVSQWKLKDQSTFFGLLWSFLNPLAMVAILFVAFNKRFGGDVEHYAVYLLIGMVQYTHFANTTNNSMRALLAMRQLTRETVFPKGLIVMSSAISNTFDFMIAMSVCVLVSWVTGVMPAAVHLWILVVLVLQFLLVSWVSLLLACIFPIARDIDHIYQVFLRGLMFVTPIFYKADFLGDGAARIVIAINPLAQLVELSRSVLIDGQAPSMSALGIAAGVNLVLFFACWQLFRTVEPRLAEYV